jgi:hypothetical protein
VVFSSSTEAPASVLPRLSVTAPLTGRVEGCESQGRNEISVMAHT